MMKKAVWIAGGFCVGILVGCTTAAVVADAPPLEERRPAITATPGALVLQGANATKREVPGKATATLFAKGARAYMGTLEVAPGAGVPEHRDPTEELLYIIEGSGQVTIDDKVYEVVADSVIYMPAGAKVSFKNGDAPLKAVQVFAEPGPESKYDAWSPVK